MWKTVIVGCVAFYLAAEAAKSTENRYRPGFAPTQRPSKPPTPPRVFKHRNHAPHRNSPRDEIGPSELPVDKIITESPGQRLTKSSNDFGMLLLRSLPDNKNALISPYSLSRAFGMLFVGANGDTKREMANVLQYSGNGVQSSEVPQGFKEVSRVVNRQNKGYNLNAANSVYVQKDYNLTQNYKNTVTRDFGAQIRSVDFSEFPERAVLDINRWASDATKGLIPKVLENQLSRSTKLVLLNAVYFKGHWKTPFSVRATFQSVFFNNGFDEKMIDMMYMRSDFLLLPLEDVNSQVLELPYAGDETTMLIVLPNTNDGLSKLVSQLSIKQLLEALPTARNITLDLYMPKFEIESSYELKEPLSEAGMRKVFQEGAADLSGIDGTHSLALSEALHKAKVKVDERGTEATAVTTLPVVNYSAHPFFTIDHPFLFFIVHRPTKSVLFSGKVVEL